MSIFSPSRAVCSVQREEPDMHVADPRRQMRTVPKEDAVVVHYHG